jgi:hypothetical protein
MVEYENQIYPADFAFDLDTDEFGRIDRSSWLVLFCIAHFQSIGRQRDQQHRGFIEKCIRKGWWETFSKPDPDRKSDEWMGVLEEFIDEQVDSSEYELWMNRFPAIYKFSRWLEDYQEAFSSINRMTDISDLSGIVNTRVNPAFQGGGVSAPSLEKSLSIGVCFIVRELRRYNILKNPKVDPFCYTPNERIRKLFEALGCLDVNENRSIDNSRQIYNFICEHLGEEQADFAGCYDIPFQIFTLREDIRSEILDYVCP